ncbi:hypothetical protein [Fischerella sp. PCC 9605]|uniref:hypothetical protein n=1 Tax=Fischerella sp. PCC 9605 TaxID=1173024 RepID=UPI00047DEF7C|nr:hypothetical protein [Fischerella sp. PCC 9605]
MSRGVVKKPSPQAEDVHACDTALSDEGVRKAIAPQNPHCVKEQQPQIIHTLTLYVVTCFELSNSEYRLPRSFYERGQQDSGGFKPPLIVILN